MARGSHGRDRGTHDREEVRLEGGGPHSDQGTFNRKKDGSSTWEFTLDGIYDGKEKGTDTTQFLFHYAYLDEARSVDSGLVGWYIICIAEPARATEIARRIDETFENSSAETKTTTEKAVAQSFANQVGDVRMIVLTIGAVVFVSLLIVTAITMAQAVRERTNELAVLKTLGFTDAHVLGLVLGESLLLVFLGGNLGIGIVWLLINGLGDPTGGMLPIFYLPASDAGLGLLMAAVLAVASGVLPAFRAMRLTIVDALGRR